MRDWEFEIIEDEITYIEEVLPRTKHFDLVSWKTIDPEHPRCYWCGKFVKKNFDSSLLSGPCPDCDDYIGPYSYLY